MFAEAEIRAALACGSDQAVVDVPGVVLFANRARSVFLPQLDRARQAEALGFFSTNALRRIVGSTQLHPWHWLGIGLRPAHLSLPASWGDRFGASLEAASLYCGSPGSLQKVSILLPPKQAGGILKLVKVALGPNADESIEREVQSLTWFAQAEAGLRRHVPELVADGLLPSGRRYLVTTASRGRRGRAALADDYTSFLQALARITRNDMKWEQGEALRHTHRQLRALQPDAIPAVIRDSLEEAIETTTAQLRGKSIPHTLMHGDFTRFNICDDGHGFVVFDWEYSRRQCNPVADILHYTLSRRRIFSAKCAMRSSIADARRFAQLAFESWRPSTRDLAALALHALIDTVVVYATSDGRLNMHDYLVTRYLGLIGSKHSWIDR